MVQKIYLKMTMTSFKRDEGVCPLSKLNNNMEELY